jgi:hypothetical protein
MLTSIHTVMELTVLYAEKNRINEMLDCKDCTPNEEDALLYQLDDVCDRIEILEAPNYDNLSPCNF